MGLFLRAGIVALLLTNGCSVDPLVAEGRPCSDKAPCGPHATCGPSGYCIPDRQMDAAADSRGLDGLKDSAPEGVQADAPRPDLPPSDLQRPDQSPDIAWPPDLTLPPDSKPIYVNESFTNGLGALQPKQGTWAVNGGEAVQTSTSDNDHYAVVSVPTTDYTVESVVTVHAIKWTSSLYEGAGVAARITAPTVAGSPPAQYACVVLVDGNMLALAEGDGQDTFLKLKKSKQIVISLNTPYRVRLQVKGKTLTCSLPDQGLTVTDSDGSLSSGPAGLTSLHAHATWDYLLVTP